jgi:hypothetical protein
MAVLEHSQAEIAALQPQHSYFKVKSPLNPVVAPPFLTVPADRRHMAANDTSAYQAPFPRIAHYRSLLNHSSTWAV